MSSASGYKPLYVRGMETGLVQSRQEFILPDDAYPVLENAFVWRERIKRKQGYQLLGRLRRVYTSAAMGNISSSGAGTATFNIFTGLGILATEPNAQLQQGNSTTITIVIGAPISQTLTDTLGTGVMSIAPPGVITAASINYASGVLTLTFSGVAGASAATFSGAYFPSLPVMGIETRELNTTNNEMTVIFDTKYAYRFATGSFQEFIPGTTWTGADDDFFWSTNYWVSAANLKLFWVTNFSGTAGDPIRYTDGATWTNFTPTINAAADVLAQSLAILSFRSRLMVFNTLEGPNLANAVQYPQRIRWSAIGSPITVNSWRDDIPGQGGYLDIPTSQSITSVGFVRDNLVIYCERSTWQLRYTGRSISPFQIEKVNSELGAESPFSAIQFDTSLVGIGDKGIVECDSYKSQRIDIKIPDLVFEFNNAHSGPRRIQGIRDFVQRLAYWTYPYVPTTGEDVIYPNRRLVYNYENDSWAIFTDSLTALGTFQPPTGRTWLNVHLPWTQCNFPWSNRQALIPAIIGGNQQGYIEYLDQQTVNDVSVYIKNITGNTTTPTSINSPSHNLATGQVIKISDIPAGTPFATSLNNHIFSIVVADADNFTLYTYSSSTRDFTNPQLDAFGSYIGGGQIAVRDNFIISSKKFNFLEEGQNIQLGYIDVLMDSTDQGAISLYLFMNYNNSSPINLLPQNVNPSTSQPDEFFNSVIPTHQSGNEISGDKYWQRIFCPVRANFITVVWTLSNEQMNGVEQESDVQIDSQILWMRKAGKQLVNI